MAVVYFSLCPVQRLQIDKYRSFIDNATVNETFIRQSVGDAAWSAAVADLSSRVFPPALAVVGLTMAEQVALYTWTLDTSKGPWFSRINRVLRMAETSSEEFETVWPLVAGIKSALDKLPPFEGVVYRAVKETPMDSATLSWFKEAYQPGKVILLDGFTSTSIDRLQILRGRFILSMDIVNGKDISALSSKPLQQEVLLGHGSRIEIDEVEAQPNGVVKIWAHEIR